MPMGEPFVQPFCRKPTVTLYELQRSGNSFPNLNFRNQIRPSFVTIPYIFSFCSFKKKSIIIWSMEFPGSLNRWYVAYNHPIGKDYKWYISGFLLPIEGLYISPIPPIKGTRNSYWFESPPVDFGRRKIPQNPPWALEDSVRISVFDPPVAKHGSHVHPWKPPLKRPGT